MIENPNKELWVALIAGLSGILGALGIKEVIPAILRWWEEKRADSKTRRMMKHDEIRKLYARIEKLEQENDSHRNFKIKTQTAFNSMIPLMKEIMKEHPQYVHLLEQLESNIFGGGDITPTDGSKKQE